MPAARRHRRLVGAARDERMLRDPVRRFCRARLGNDRDVAGRYRLQSAAQARRAVRWSSVWPSRRSKGRAVYGVDMKIVDDDGGVPLPRDGKVCRPSAGTRAVDQPVPTYRDEGSDILDADGFFDTGDVATIDADGLHADHRSLEGRRSSPAASGFRRSAHRECGDCPPGGRRSGGDRRRRIRKWQERPLLIIVRKPAQELTWRSHAAVSRRAGWPTWWLPDDVAFVEELPHTATGKLHKLKLRERFKDYRLPGA
jgi:acyl-CoA synthetase (AMP-forming)/AMP-acid ligase II